MYPLGFEAFYLTQTLILPRLLFSFSAVPACLGLMRTFAGQQPSDQVMFALPPSYQFCV